MFSRLRQGLTQKIKFPLNKELFKSSARVVGKYYIRTGIGIGSLTAICGMSESLCVNAHTDLEKQYRKERTLLNLELVLIVRFFCIADSLLYPIMYTFTWPVAIHLLFLRYRASIITGDCAWIIYWYEGPMLSVIKYGRRDNLHDHPYDIEELYKLFKKH